MQGKGLLGAQNNHHSGMNASSNTTGNTRLNIGNPDMAAAMSGKLGNVPSFSSASSPMPPHLQQQQHHLQPISASLSSASSTGSLGQLQGHPGALGPKGSFGGAANPDGASSSTAESDPKIAAMLEINAELLNICMAFQARGVPTSDMRYQQYQSKLQGNLHFLAQVMDPNAPQNASQMPHPHLEPPPAVDFASMDRIQQLYAGLPTLFAKEISRRQQMNMIMSAQQRGQNLNINIAPSSVANSGPTPPGSANGIMSNAMGGNNGAQSISANSVSNNLKRERTEEQLVDGVGPVERISNKRRDTGENKSMMPPPSSIPVGMTPDQQQQVQAQQQMQMQQRMQQQQHMMAQQQQRQQRTPIAAAAAAAE
ncbi:hypothetical protein DFP72DRAFT_558704 [Ephemerocybe angulata]|uniref:Uncharacterized protein n=1 Tax=Ephemerocybe angulata TaxID=980116 RepID=A0A8H6IDQ5_9AGAR|nr:hypothetical protein DFP72DRAFT_558704 [Tulosesus angulatus]